MAGKSRDGLYLVVLGIAVFLLFGFALRFSAKDSMADFRVAYIGARCLVQHCDPYNQNEFSRFYQTEVARMGAKTADSRLSATSSVNLPPALLFIAPLATLPFGLASALWMMLSAASLVLAAVLIFDLAKGTAPVLAGGLIALVMGNCAIVLGNGNAAGLVIGLSAIGVWCFLRERFELAGILCLAVALAIKPHDVCFVWLYFLLAGGIYRKFAWRSMAATIVFYLAAFLWVAQVSPRWIPEARTNISSMAAHGNNNDPGPAGPTSTRHSMEAIIDLQAVLSVFVDQPRFYNTSSYVIEGILLLVWSVAILRATPSLLLASFALAAITPLTLLLTYHRAYDARLLLLTIPACAALWARGGPIARAALCVNLAGTILTGEISLAVLAVFTKNLHADAPGLLQRMETIILMRPGPLALLAMGIFYLWVFVRVVKTDERIPENRQAAAISA